MNYSEIMKLLTLFTTVDYYNITLRLLTKKNGITVRIFLKINFTAIMKSVIKVVPVDSIQGEQKHSSAHS
jgi:hypothetical protein